MGEIAIYSTENTTIKNNIFYSTHANSNLLYVDDSHLNLDMNFNHYYSSSPDVKFYWKGSIFSTFEQYKQNTGCDLASAFSNPLFIDTEVFDFQLQSTSPCIDTGDPPIHPQRMNWTLIITLGKLELVLIKALMKSNNKKAVY